MSGLAKLDPKQKYFRIYDKSDGLVHNQFNWHASLKGKNGIFYFGGINGFRQF